MRKKEQQDNMSYEREVKGLGRIKEFIKFSSERNGK